MSYNGLYSNWIEVDLGVIENNIQHIKDITSVDVMAIVKANAYGHGTIPIARAAAKAGASWFGVARIEEALEIRSDGIEAPILILGFTPPGGIDPAINQGISLTIWEDNQVTLISKTASRLGKTARIHLKVDTGMSRLGVQPEQALPLAEAIRRAPGLDLEGIFTHFARADESDPAPTANQEAQFCQVLDKLKTAGINPPILHAANSAGSLTRPSARFNLVRTGIAMYGLDPSTDCRLPQGFRPALSWMAQLSQVKELPAGRGVSYGHEYVTRGIERIGTVPVGYADGFRRTKGNQVLVCGKRVPVVGRVCMDQISVLLNNTPEAIEGDEVVLIGKQGDEIIKAEEIGRIWGTVNYEVLCGLGARVPRVYSH
jgi:alanine racemase